MFDLKCPVCGTRMVCTQTSCDEDDRNEIYECPLRCGSFSSLSDMGPVPQKVSAEVRHES